MGQRPALFLDRDGVINVDHGYVCTPERTEFIDGIFDLVRLANRTSHLVVVVTNQAGIARGYYSEDDFHRYMEWMSGVFVQHGARLDAIYYCPHHRDGVVENYARECSCRKPEPGMLLAAQRECDISLERSLLVGDKPSDIQAGKNAGVRHCVLMRSEPDEVSGRMTLRAADLQLVVALLESGESPNC
ncbi:HAD family hydrolase [Rhodanobacter sp. FDAARGOS 1247]|jgi:D-glycero-D-manno-heptose 1,7-bisphosphate phosphatase|uniref:D-glycero-alpha-D-manno-heptose-1,7-bisphosphate 7-phosphatase n=1 Tax=Rhodanobacter sp. FDAARGOS 1247 TaxID=2778082 RepID=UPI00194F081B|nr:HAD family hydrolase [Rhodanobacter sp. FDAARGOS 1247]QRP63358.1 HAD family hydrolase [Rhodanobacter sp. FDAARGOS 1247]